jgi:hypothetical protein
MDIFWHFNPEGISIPVFKIFGKDIAFLCAHVCSEQLTNSFLFGRVLNKTAAGGRMGGGASFLAMTNNSNINAVFNFAAAGNQSKCHGQVC